MKYYNEKRDSLRLYWQIQNLKNRFHCDNRYKFDAKLWMKLDSKLKKNNFDEIFSIYY